jgi:hypothetical protein
MHKYAMILMLAIGCGDGGGGGSTTTGGGTTGGGTTGRQVSFSCCINGSYFDCPSQAALDKCIPPNFMGAPDPSQCTRNSGKDNTCGQGTTGTNGGTTGSAGGCSNATVWNVCSIDADCNDSLLHCTNGKCYSNAGGSPCNIDADCGNVDHCTNGCCYADQSGSPCNIDGDCGPASSCVNGVCN